MNQLHDPKIDLSLILLAENSQAIIEQKLAPDNHVIRKLVDERRQLKANIQIQKTQIEATLASTDSIVEKLNDEAEAFVKAWITELKALPWALSILKMSAFVKFSSIKSYPKPGISKTTRLL